MRTDEWMSTPDTARLLGVTTRTVYRMVDAGRLPAYRFGRVIRFRRHEIGQFIGASLVAPAG